MSKTKKQTLPPNQRDADRLRSEARWAYLDGRTKRAKELNKQADAIEKQLRSSRHWAYDHSMDTKDLVGADGQWWGRTPA